MNERTQQAKEIYLPEFNLHNNNHNKDNLNALTGGLDARTTFEIKHKGHDFQHFLIAFIIIGSLFISPTLVKYWRRKSYKTYQIANILVIWVYPFIISVKAGFHRFLVSWTAYSLVNFYIFYISSRKPLHQSTPGLVYQWFSYMNKITFSISIFGLVVFFAFYFSPLQPTSLFLQLFEYNLIALFYGLYFGILTQDLVNICIDRVSATLGYYSISGIPSKSLPKNVCSICGLQLANFSAESSLGTNKNQSHTHTHTQNQDQGQNQNQNIGQSHPLEVTGTDMSAYILNCKHTFHNSCIRGWCLIGKRDTCPYCHERVDLRPLMFDTWDKQQTAYLKILDFFRFVIGWQPVTLLLAISLISVLGLD